MAFQKQQQETEMPDERYNKYATKQSFEPQHTETTKYLLEMEQIILTKLRHYRGQYLDEGTGETVQVCEEENQLMNERGIQYANRQFRHFMHKGASLANLTKEQVSNITMAYASRVRMHLLVNIIPYHIREFSTIDEVKNDIVELAFLNLTRSIDDKERDYISKGRKVIEQTAHVEQAPAAKRMKMW